jgi:Fe-Mn family superoxide dismutase
MAGLNLTTTNKRFDTRGNRMRATMHRQVNDEEKDHLPGAQRARRAFLKTTTSGVVAGGLMPALPALWAQEPNMSALPKFSKSFAASHELKPLPFDAARLNGLSAKLIESHWSNNYGGSVKTLNAVKERLAQALADKDTPPFAYNSLKREHLLRTGSVVLHELYFDNLGGNGRADADIRASIASAFGDFTTWENEFNRISIGLGGGSGWVVLGYNTHFQTLENYWLADHMHFPASTVPLLVLDMYEHSYQMDYGAATARYVDAFFQNIQWEVVATRFEGAQKRFQTVPVLAY